MAKNDWWYDNDGPSATERRNYRELTNLAEYMGMSRENAQKYFDNLDETIHVYDKGVEAVVAGYRSNIPFNRVQEFIDKGIDREQMYALGAGIRDGLSDSQLNVLANENYSYDLMNVIESGFAHKYSHNADISEETMQKAIFEFTNGHTCSDKFFYAVQSLANGDSLDNIERIDKEFDKLVYPSELKAVYQAGQEGLTDEQIHFCIEQRKAEEQEYGDKDIDGTALRCWCIALEAGYSGEEAKDVRNVIESIELFTGDQYSTYWPYMNTKYDLNFWSIAGPQEMLSETHIGCEPNINIDYLQIPVYMGVNVNDKQVEWYVFEPEGADKEPFAVQKYDSFQDMKADFDKCVSCSVCDKKFTRDEMLKARDLYKDALEHSNEKGRLIVICGPSGVGKTTTVKELQGKVPFVIPPSYTTREPRKGEVDGVDYCFVDKDTFSDMQAKGQFLESAEFNGNFYGTSKDNVEKALDSGKNVLLDLELQGAKAVKDIFKDSVTVFMDVHDDKEREQRLRNRSSDSEEVIQQRMEQGQADRKEYSNIRGKREHIYIENNDTREAAFELADIMEFGHRTYEHGEFDSMWPKTIYDIDMQFSEDWQPVKEKVQAKKEPEKVSSGIPFDDR